MGRGDGLAKTSGGPAYGSCRCRCGDASHKAGSRKNLEISSLAGCGKSPLDPTEGRNRG